MKLYLNNVKISRGSYGFRSILIWPRANLSAIEVASLNIADLNALAAKTTLMIAAVGPYAQHGEVAFQACAENGTHYLDTTGEVAWVSLMIKKYGALAKKNNCIMIPQCGLESAPPDLCVWALAKEAREKYNKPIGETVLSVHELRYASRTIFVNGLLIITVVVCQEER